MPGQYRLYRQPGVTQGVITGKKSENHQNVTYRFTVNGKNYHGESGIGDAYDSAAAGQTVPLIYDPTDPDESSIYDLDHPHRWGLTSPQEAFVSLLLILSVFSLMGGCLFAWSFSYARRRWI